MPGPDAYNRPRGRKLATHKEGWQRTPAAAFRDEGTGMLSDDLEKLAIDLAEAVDRGNEPPLPAHLDRLEAAITEIAKAWSGSYAGYHTRLYWEGFEKPPSGTFFDTEWGPTRSTEPEKWIQYEAEDVRQAITKKSSYPLISSSNPTAAFAHSRFDRARASLMSMLSLDLRSEDDPLLNDMLESIKALRIRSAQEVVHALMPEEQSSRDPMIRSRGLWVPEHLQQHAQVLAVRGTFEACGELSGIAKHAAEHVARRERMSKSAPAPTAGTKVFIGHGRSPVWRELRDYLERDLKLTCDEFDSQPTEGDTITGRLSTMLDDAAFAFLVMTGEDKTSEGTMQARLNVIHELGLFQGRLGFKKAIILLEEGCGDFSNLHGQIHISFPQGKIEPAYHRIRRVLEREGLVRKLPDA